LLGFPTYPVPRTAHVIAGEPIAVSDMLATGELTPKAALPLTELLERNLGRLLG
jgi:hypothetical protein